MAGRPSDYEPRYAQIAEELMLEGASIEEVCWHLRRRKQVVYEWMEKFPEFGDAIKAGKDFGQGWWMNQGRTNIANKDFNSTLWYMNMKNRFGWRDKQETSAEDANTTLMQKLIDKL